MQKFHTDDHDLYPDLGTFLVFSDWSYCMGNQFQAFRSTTHLWVVTRHQYGISALFSRMFFHRETSVGVARCWLFSQAKKEIILMMFAYVAGLSSP